jgi:UDP-N-acetylmuramoyl-L-alanyl-D-glutamate--2,6-diaminopimelate ligase
MEVAVKNKNMTVLVDYAHNAMAMENLLKTLRDYKPHRLVVVFGCGGNRSKDRRYGMGETAAKMADLSILTADNSRFEKTEDIIADIKSTLIPAGGSYIEIPDRREAIVYAMTHAETGDMIAVIGKGHEDYQEVNGVRTHFLDREVIQETAAMYHL